MSLSAEQVRWVAHLARLDLTPGELETMTRQLAAILEYVDQLRQVDTEGVEPLAHALAVENVFREDEPAPSLPPEAALANAPDARTVTRTENGATRVDRFYGVPAVFAEDAPSH